MTITGVPPFDPAGSGPRDLRPTEVRRDEQPETPRVATDAPDPPALADVMQALAQAYTDEAVRLSRSLTNIDSAIDYLQGQGK